MRSCETSTQSLTPISWPTYLCISFGWANSLFAISYLGSVYCLAPARYHEINRLRTTLSLSCERVPLHPRCDHSRGVPVASLQLRAICSDRVPLVSSLHFPHHASHKNAHEEPPHGV